MKELNPVLLKELRQRFRTYRSPLVVLLYLLVLGGFSLGYIYLRWRSAPAFFQPGSSKEIFTVLSMAQLGLLAFVVPGLTAGVISGERERQTLNVLLTTELTPLGIVVSKMISSCSFTALLLFATLPLYSLVFMFGGLAPLQILGVLGFFLVSMLLYAAIGVSCSTYFKRTGISTITSYGIVFFLVAGTAFLSGFIYTLYQQQAQSAMIKLQETPLIVQLLQDTNPVMVVLRILGENATFGPGREMWLPYWGTYTVTCVVISVVLILWSGWKLNPMNHNRKLFR
ncbi:ABC transporter permease [Desulforamulus aeronauticus]|uniref:ABC-type transport system involved in multi-copper enzyme maturation, permease component n=1 Tax=Desulforamulus aeronauticus DSM 10349 TaxID=1121421 RepID=A0A1M6TLD4_9FIRM|nr:ABC transporter permease [Desulforamulus aeronauticus]SHK57578.1 ABC-type transport system involved in multi-copper enzyme maturation, permease component [Desulforamulus aeronauticus DSM 10349]